MKNNVVFLGGNFPRELKEEILGNSKTQVQDAADNLQWALIEGLDTFFPDMKNISAPDIYSWPKSYKAIRFQERRFSHKPGANDTAVGFCNIPLYNLYSRYQAIKKALFRWGKSLPRGETKTVVVYGLTSNRLLAACALKNKIANVKIVQIVPDLPQFMSESRNPFYRTLKWIDFHFIKAGLKATDGIVLLSEKMRKKLPIANKPFCVVEGIFLPSPKKIIAEREVNPTILYTGNLGVRSGVRMLLDAFSQIKNSQFRLWIRGEGVLETEVRKAAKADARIKYLPRMTRDEILTRQKRATILVNPVSPDEPYADYFFPSKTMEYLASGAAVVMFKLGCLPKEYFPFLHFPEQCSTKSLAQKLQEVASMQDNERRIKGESAEKFIFCEKSETAQVRKIVELIRTIL